MSSAYSAYSAQINSVYSTPATSIKSKQEPSDVQIPGTSSNDEINDEAIISDEAMALYNKDKTEETTTLPGEKKSQSDNLPKSSEKQLTPEQQQEIAKLKAADAEVKTHEQAHIAAAAGLRTSAPSYQYETGPDGKKYAVAGEVSISFSKTGDPQKDIVMAETLKSAALAPANPSGQDMAVAKQAEEMIQQDKNEIQEQNQQQTDATQKTGQTGQSQQEEPMQLKHKSDKSENMQTTGQTDAAQQSEASETAQITAENTGSPTIQNNTEPVDVLRVQQNRPPITVM